MSNLAKPVKAGQGLLEAMEEFAGSLDPLDPHDRSFMLTDMRQAIESQPKIAMFFRELQIAWLQRGIKDIKNKVAQAKKRRKRPKP